MRSIRLYSLLAMTGLLLLVSESLRAQSSPAVSPSPATGSQNAPTAGAQQNASPHATTAPVAPAPPATASSAVPSLNPHAQLILANTDKLVDLVQQLKTEMDKTNQDVLSLNTIHQAEDIEKLAKELEKQLERAKK